MEESCFEAVPELESEHPGATDDSRSAMPIDAKRPDNCSLLMTLSPSSKRRF
jgi:hypothetical protein